jgi:hypothetical protein
VDDPVEASSTASIPAAQAQNNPTTLVTLAKGLKARIVTSGVAAPNFGPDRFVAERRPSDPLDRGE